MAILKIYEPESKGARELFSYITDENKTKLMLDGKDVLLVESVNCCLVSVPEEFEIIRKRYKSKDSLIHMIVMFREGELGEIKAFETGKEILFTLFQDEFQAVMAVHLNKDNLHCHFLVNCVSINDGRGFREHYRRKDVEEIINTICLDRNLSTHISLRRKSLPYIVKKKQNSGFPTKFNLLKMAIDEAVGRSSSYTEFEMNLKKRDIRLIKNGNIFKAVLTGESLNPPLEFLGYAYTIKGIERRITLNRRNGRARREVKKKGNRYSFPSREDFLLKKKGILNEYSLLSLYMDGHPKRYDREKFLDMSLSLKHEAAKLYRYTRRIRFISKYRFTEDGQLMRFLMEKEAEERKVFRERESLGAGYFVKRSNPMFAAFQMCTAKLRSIREDIRTGREILSERNSLKEMLGDICRERRAGREMAERSMGRHK